jgi:hypothetical protein
MPRLNKTEKYAICWLSSNGKTPIEISDELKIPVKQVNDTIAKNKINNTDNNIPTNTKPVYKKPSVQDMIITRTAGKKIGGVSIMTKEASEAADALRHKTSPKLNNNIYRLNKKDK